jgi:hypothetical protein
MEMVRVEIAVELTDPRRLPIGRTVTVEPRRWP